MAAVPDELQSRGVMPLVVCSRPATCRFIGEWYEKEGPHHAPTEEQIAEGSRSCFIVGGIYLGWVVFALFCVCVMGARGRR